MNTEATLEKMRQLKLMAMGQAYQAFLSLPLQEQTASSVSATLATFIDAEIQDRQARKTLATVRAARFRYQASLEEVEYLPERNLDKHLLLQTLGYLLCQTRGKSAHYGSHGVGQKLFGYRLRLPGL